MKNPADSEFTLKYGKEQDTWIVKHQKMHAWQGNVKVRCNVAYWQLTREWVCLSKAGDCHELCIFSYSYLTMRPFLLSCRSLYVFLYYHRSCISVFCSALIRSSYVSFHFSIKGCAWFPSRVQQFLCQMTRSWHHASALHFALHCSALVWDCLGFWIDI